MKSVIECLECIRTECNAGGGGHTLDACDEVQGWGVLNTAQPQCIVVSHNGTAHKERKRSLVFCLSAGSRESSKHGIQNSGITK